MAWVNSVIQDPKELEGHEGRSMVLRCTVGGEGGSCRGADFISQVRLQRPCAVHVRLGRLAARDWLRCRVLVSQFDTAICRPCMQLLGKGAGLTRQGKARQGREGVAKVQRNEDRESITPCTVKQHESLLES
eukprot:1157841-Pelagomonas_calceolata.AAC.7